jgi:outer membrane receptor for ferrienterochelin and colicins
MAMSVLAAAYALGVALALGAPADGSPACAVSGVVHDSTGLALPGVVVSAGAVTATTDGDGRFCLPAVGEATAIEARLDGFVPLRRRLADLKVDGGVTLTLVPAFHDETVVTATRTSRRLDDVPVRTEVIGRDDIERIGARTLADAVEFTTGVRVENNCQNCNFSQIRLLGLEGPYTQILIDGQPMVSSLAQVYGIEQLPARMIERVEVVKGGGSALYGPGSVGGVVNILSREPARSGGGATVRSEMIDGQATYSSNGAMDWVSRDQRATVTGFAQVDRVPPVDLTGDGYSEVSRRALDAGGGRATLYALDRAAKLTADVTLMREARRGGNAFDRPPHEADIAESIDSRRTAASATWYHMLSPRQDYRLTVGWADTDRDSYYGTGQDPNAYGRTRSDLVVADAQANRFLQRHTVTVGGQLSWEALDDAQPAYGRQSQASYRNAGVLVQDDWTLGRGWQLLIGTRADRHSAMDRLVLSPRAAVMYSPLPALDIRVSAASGFRAPQIFDEDLHLSSVGGEMRVIQRDPALREERSLNVMAGAEWKPVVGPGQALVEINGFSTRLRDLFHVRNADDPATGPLEFLRMNLGGARVSGVEMNLGWGHGDEFVVQGGLVLQEARYDDPEPEFGSRDFFRTPNRYGNLTVAWKAPVVGDLFAGLRYTGPMVVPHYFTADEPGRLERSPSFVTLDLGLTRTLAAIDRRTVALVINARNVTNAYQRDLDQGPLRDANYVYGPRLPRSVGAGLTVGF